MHNTKEKNDDFRRAFDATNERWMAQQRTAPFKLNQRVKTAKYGDGLIVDFERIESVNKTAEHVSEYQIGDRIGIRLDNPENWPMHSFSSGVPYFLPFDIIEG